MNSVVLAMVVLVGSGLIAMAVVALIGAAIVGQRILRPRPWIWTFRSKLLNLKQPGGETS
jgi:hypothetical protein